MVEAVRTYCWSFKDSNITEMLEISCEECLNPEFVEALNCLFKVSNFYRHRLFYLDYSFKVRSWWRAEKAGIFFYFFSLWIKMGKEKIKPISFKDYLRTVGDAYFQETLVNSNINFVDFYSIYTPFISFFSGVSWNSQFKSLIAVISLQVKWLIRRCFTASNKKYWHTR